MVQHATEPLTRTATVYWTQFPASALPVNWSDHKAAHRQIMGLFPRDLPGHPGERRAHNHVLYRLDAHGSTPTVLVQSTTRPALVPVDAKTLAIPPHRWGHPEDTRIQFRLTANPITRLGSHRDGHPAPQRRPQERLVPLVDIEAWFTSKLTAAGLTDITLHGHYRDTTRAGKHALTVDTVDGVATVADRQALAQAQLHGIGRAKSYGCGLLTSRAL